MNKKMHEKIIKIFYANFEPIVCQDGYETIVDEDSYEIIYEAVIEEMIEGIYEDMY
ncbi:MAG: hypothetical protein K8R11_09690 [Methanococcoides sp.]|nr:hypothetical protein [Methanococcoides sp.]